MAEERARRILSHAGVGVGGNPRGIRCESVAATVADEAVNGSQWRQSERVADNTTTRYYPEVRSSGADSAALSAAAPPAPAPPAFPAPAAASAAAASAVAARSGGDLGRRQVESLQMELHHPQFHHRGDSIPTSNSSSSASTAASAAAAAMDPVTKLWGDEYETAGSMIGSSIASRVRAPQGQNWGAEDWPVADDCIFCKIVHGFAPAFKIYEDEFCVCILDINPLCYGHSLLLPKGHFPALDATPPPVAAAMCSVVPLLSNAIMAASSCDSFNMVVNNGEAAGQVVFHTHFHIVPRYSGDGLWTNESVVRKPLSSFKDPAQLALSVRSILRNKS